MFAEPSKCLDLVAEPRDTGPLGRRKCWCGSFGHFYARTDRRPLDWHAVEQNLQPNRPLAVLGDVVDYRVSPILVVGNLQYLSMAKSSYSKTRTALGAWIAEFVSGKNGELSLLSHLATLRSSAPKIGLHGIGRTCDDLNPNRTHRKRHAIHASSDVISTRSSAHELNVEVPILIVLHPGAGLGVVLGNDVQAVHQGSDLVASRP
mmetsp:Transcript_31452/g.67547  ORF Transcript_31452/g.67547 Transcript_31452/m.67547 type:complete len:205 (-) Transcript_31452:151-765(-)